MPNNKKKALLCSAMFLACGVVVSFLVAISQSDSALRTILTVLAASVFGLLSTGPFLLFKDPVLERGLSVRESLPKVRDFEDALALGSRPVAHVLEPGAVVAGRVPPYVGRDCDDAITSALAGCGLVLLVGDSASGKTRTAYEAMRRVLGDRNLFVPTSRESLPQLVGTGFRFENVVVWLDDLERYLGPGGITPRLVRDLCADPARRVNLLGTMRSTLFRAYGGRLPREARSEVRAGQELLSQAAAVLDLATVVWINRRLSTGELAGAKSLSRDPRLGEAIEHSDQCGLAEYLTAGPALLAALREPAADEAGRAVVMVAIDCRRSGLRGPVRIDLLCRLYPEYVPPGLDRGFRRGLEWATTPQPGRAGALLVRIDGDRCDVSDYLVDNLSPELDSRPVPDVTWQAVLDEAGSAGATAVGMTAYRAGRFGVCEQAFRLGMRSGDTGKRAAAAFGLGYLLRQRGSTGEAEEMFRQAAADGDEEAVYHLGLLLHEQGRVAEASRWLSQAAAAGNEQAWRMVVRMQDDQSADEAPPGIPPVPLPQEIPHDINGFSGRLAELRRLDAILDASAGTAGVVVIDGAPGVGKSALAVHWAQRVADQFPDGQVYLDLRGFDPRERPLSPADALGNILRSLGVAPRNIPQAPSDKARIYRSHLADKRVLLLLDNAASAAQVRPLLPGSPSCFAVVTSRIQLGGLVAREGSHLISLDMLTPDDAVAMVARIVGQARVAAEPEATDMLGVLCGYLPLALRIAAQRIATHRHLTLADLITELAAERDRLDVLSSGDDETATVRAIFSWSYRSLPSDAGGLFRLLGLHTGVDISGHAAAALAGIPLASTRRLLGVLTDRHLLQKTARDRFRFHDLVRVYAAECAAVEEPEQVRVDAVRRLLTWYLQTAWQADMALVPQRRRVEPGVGAEVRPELRFADRGQALDWCEAERRNLVAATEQAANSGLYEIAWKLPITLWGYFNLRKPWEDWILTHRVGLDAAQRLGDIFGQAWILNNLGEAYRYVVSPDEAFDCYNRALSLYQDVGDRRGCGSTLHNMGNANRELNNDREALESYHQALVLREEIGDQWGTAGTLTGMGNAYRALKDFDDALRCYRKALDIRRSISDRYGEASTLHHLGKAYREMELFPAALDSYRQALEIRRAISDRWGEARTLVSLGKALVTMGRFDEARQHWLQALATFEDLEDPTAGDIRERLETLDLPTQAAQGRKFWRDNEVTVGLASRGAVRREVNRRIADGQIFAVCSVDIDGLGEIRANQGDIVGDGITKAVAENVGETAVMESAQAGYLGKDDFLVVSDLDGLVPAASRILDARYMFDGLPVTLSVATLVCAAGSVSGFHEIEHLLGALRTQAQALRGSSWVLGRPGSDRTDVLRGTADSGDITAAETSVRRALAQQNTGWSA